MIVSIVNIISAVISVSDYHHYPYGMPNHTLENNQDIVAITVVGTGSSSIGYRACFNSSVEIVRIYEGVSRIEESAFQSCARLHTFEAPSIEFYGTRAFAGTINLRKIELNVGSERGDSLFVGSGIETVKDAGSVIGNQQYAGTGHLSIEITRCVVIDERAFELTETHGLVFPDTLSRIEANAFDHAILNNPVQSGPMTSIGTQAFQYSNIINFVLTVETISEAAFKNATIENIRIHTNKLNVYCFQWATILGEFVFTGTIIESYSFLDAKFMNHPSINSVTYIGLGAFQNSELDRLVLPSSVLYIGISAFSGSSIQIFPIEEGSSVRHIGNDAFAETAITEVNFATTLYDLTFVGDKLFRRGYVTTIFHSDYSAAQCSQKRNTLNDWFDSSQSGCALDLCDTTCNCSTNCDYIPSTTTTTQTSTTTYPPYCEAQVTKEFDSLPDEGECNVTTAILHVSEVNRSALDPYPLIEVRLPSSDIIGTSAFENYRILEKVILGESTRIIGSRSFWGCSSLRLIRFPPSIEEIRTDAFAFSGLYKIELPTGGIIQSGAFSSIPSLFTVDTRAFNGTIVKGAFDGFCKEVKPDVITTCTPEPTSVKTLPRAYIFIGAAGVVLGGLGLVCAASNKKGYEKLSQSDSLS